MLEQYVDERTADLSRNRFHAEVQKARYCIVEVERQSNMKAS
jgi:hypothetical protein